MDKAQARYRGYSVAARLQRMALWAPWGLAQGAGGVGPGLGTNPMQRLLCGGPLQKLFCGSPPLYIT